MGCVLKEGCTQRTESFLKINTRGLLSDAACCQGEDAASDDALFWRVKRIPGPPVVMQKVGFATFEKDNSISPVCASNQRTFYCSAHVRSCHCFTA